jgi:hypothetical protein
MVAGWNKQIIKGGWYEFQRYENRK